jgi:hypothetical protein
MSVLNWVRKENASPRSYEAVCNCQIKSDGSDGARAAVY